MVLKFTFTTLYKNNVLENILYSILNKIAQNSELSGFITSKDYEVFLYVKGESEKLEIFSDEFSRLLPLSLFYSFKNVTVVENAIESQNITKHNINLPFTQTMLSDFLDTNSKYYRNVSIKEEDGKILSGENINYEQIKEAANVLKQGKIIRISTRDGIKYAGVISEKHKDILKNHSFCVLATDFSFVQKMLVINDKESLALASLEKPILNLKVNLIYQNKNILPSPFVDIRLSDTLLLLALCKELFEEKEEFLFLCDDELNYNFSLVLPQNTIAKPLYINVLKNGDILQLKPNDYTAFLKLPTFKNKSHERFSSILYEYNLFSTINACFFLSKVHEDSFMVYSEKLGLLDLVKIELPQTIHEVLELIAKNKNGKKLLQNYEKKYGDLLIKAKKVNITGANNFYTLLGIVALLLGFSDDIESSANKLLLNAKNSALAKGLRVDIKLNKSKFPDSINIRKFIQSGLSYKLAGVNDLQLSFGYVDSIAYFLSDLADIIKKEFKSENIGLCGELFSHKNLLENSIKNIKPNHKIFINKAFSIE